MHKIIPGQVAISAALPMPMDGVSLIGRLAEQLYGEGDWVLDYGHDGFLQIRVPAVLTPRTRATSAEAETSSDVDGVLREFRIADDHLHLTLEESAALVIQLSHGFHQWFTLSGGINYVTVKLLGPGENDAPYMLTLQKAGNPDAHELRIKAEDRVALLEEQLRALGEEPTPC